jgi:hypothetical protein
MRVGGYVNLSEGTGPRFQESCHPLI